MSRILKFQVQTLLPRRLGEFMLIIAFNGLPLAKAPSGKCEEQSIEKQTLPEQ